MFLHLFLSRMFIASASCPPVTLLLVMLYLRVLFCSSFVHPELYVPHSESKIQVQLVKDEEPEATRNEVTGEWREFASITRNVYVELHLLQFK